MDSSEYRFGLYARRIGKTAGECPYSFASQSAEEWLLGWNAGQPSPITRLRQFLLSKGEAVLGAIEAIVRR